MKAAGKKVAKKAARKAAKKPAKKAAPAKAKKAIAKPAAKTATKTAPKKPAAKTTSPSSNGGPITWNFKLLSHHLLDGFGGMGEGMSIQIAPDGRRILWLAHESAPKNFTAVDVSDPRKPKVVVQTDLPQAHMRSNSLETCGNLMAVAYQTQKKGQQPAGMELFDISVPEKPKSISFFDCSGETSRGVHQLWFCDGEYVHTASGAADFKPTHPNDDQFYRCIDVRNPSKPVELGRWHMPGTKQGDNVMPPPRHPLDKGYRAHNCNVYPQRPDRCYLAYIDGGMFVLDISDKANPKRISEWTNSPPYTGFMHTVVPLFDRGLMLVTDESTENNAKDWPKLIWVLDAREETNLVPISTCPLPDHQAFAAKGRFGAHNIHENVPLPTAWQNDQIVLGTFFNGGLARLRHRQPVPAAADRRVRAAGAADGAHRHHPAQRRVRRRARDRLHRRPPHRRALHPGDGFLRLPGAAARRTEKQPRCSLVSRAQRSAQRCAADPGSSRIRIWNGPGSAVQHFALHRVRDTDT